MKAIAPACRHSFVGNTHPILKSLNWMSMSFGTSKAGYKNICEIGKERIHRARTQIVGAAFCRLHAKQDDGRQDAAPTDVGFKVFKIV